MEYNNYSFNFKEGKFCLKSKTPKEGYTKYDTTNPKTGEELVRYIKYVDEVKGCRISSVRINDFYGEKLNVSIYNDVDKVMEVLQVPLSGDYGYTNEARQLLRVLGNYELGRPISVRVTKKEESYTNAGGQEKSYTNVTFWMNYLDEQKDDGKHPNVPFIPVGDIPKSVKEEKRGKTVYNNDVRDDFFFDVFTKVQNALTEQKTKREAEYQASKSENSTTQQAKPAALTPNVSEFDATDDDLPF